MDVSDAYDPRVHDYDMYCYAGETWAHTIILKNDDGSVKDLTSYDAYMQIRSSKNNALIAEPIIIKNNTSGTLSLVLMPEMTSNVQTRDARYDLFLVDQAGNRHCLVKGKFIIVPRATII